MTTEIPESVLDAINYCVFMRSIYLHACELFETSRR
jgi:hypothetical protein